MAVRRLKFPLTINQGTGMAVSNTGVDFIGVSSLIQTISIPQEITTISNVQFNAVTSSTSTLLLGSTILSEAGFSDNFNTGGSLDVSDSLTVVGDATVSENVTAEQIISELTSTATLYKSGSTLFGDTADDTHDFSGSVYQSGSMAYNGYVIDEISNDTSFTDASSTAVVTENAVKYFIDNSALFIDRQQYVRKNSNRNASSVSNNTASFSAFSASAPSAMVSNNENDFIFFNNGQIMEHDALQIQQSEGTFYLIVDPDNIGYNIESNDEIKAWGKFEPVGYLDFDGETNEVTTTFSGSGATPVNKTYSWWMNASETGSNQGVFAYGTSKREAFLINASQSSMGKPLIKFANHMYKYFMTPDHEEQGGGTSGNSDSGASEGTAHISAQDDGKWHHWMLFTGASDPQSSSLYIDGVEQDTAKFGNTGTLNTQTDPLTIGTIDSGTTENEHFSGSLKEFSVFGGDKTSNASIYYNNGTPYDVTNEIGLQSYWRMDENQGTIAYDSSGEGNHGTIDGATWST